MVNLTTVTDDQIREVRERAWVVYADACRALGFDALTGAKHANPGALREARAAIVAVINARTLDL